MGQLEPPPAAPPASQNASVSPFLEPPSHLARFDWLKRIRRHVTRFIVATLAKVWRIVKKFWWTVIIGSLAIAVITQVVTQGLDSLSDLLNYAAVQAALKAITANPLTTGILAAGVAVMLFLASIADRHVTREESFEDEYIMQRVDDVRPNDVRLFKYVPSVYLKRHDAETGSDADLVARKTLEAAKNFRASDSAGSLGIWVVGRPTQGKTRLAWQAIRRALPDALLVKWPYVTPQVAFPYAAVRGRTVVLWLDDLQKYLSGTESSRLSELPRRFANANARLIVVATCRSGDEETVKLALGDLLARLTPIRPADMTDEEACALAAALQTAGQTIYWNERDKTPGSLLLGVERMRDEVYPTLTTEAKAVLKAMKLLVSAGIYDYPEVRVRAVASDPDLFGPLAGNWRAVLDALDGAGFIGLVKHEGSDLTLEPVADVYLEEAIPDYPDPRIPGASELDHWPTLERIFIHTQDIVGLVSLAHAIIISNDDSIDLEGRASSCFREALQIVTHYRFPMEKPRDSNWEVELKDLQTTLGPLEFQVVLAILGVWIISGLGREIYRSIVEGPRSIVEGPRRPRTNSPSGARLPTPSIDEHS